MKALVAGLIALCFLGVANAGVLTYRLDNGNTFSVTLPSGDERKSAAECYDACARAFSSDMAVGNDFIRFDELAIAEGAGWYSSGFVMLDYRDVYFEGQIVTGYLIMYVIDFGDWKGLTMEQILSRRGTYQILVPPPAKYQIDYYYFCENNPGVCPETGPEGGNFLLTSIDGVTTPIPAAGIFLITGLLGLIGIRGVRTSR